MTNLGNIFKNKLNENEKNSRRYFEKKHTQNRNRNHHDRLKPNSFQGKYSNRLNVIHTRMHDFNTFFVRVTISKAENHLHRYLFSITKEQTGTEK